MKKRLLILLAAIPILFVACSGGNTPDSALLLLSNSGKILPLEDISYDWGNVNIEGGKVAHTFKFKNDGDEDLIIKSANTSCMCTTALVEDSHENFSPLFGMHESQSWGQAIKPGEEFTVEVVFDPMAHGPSAVGPINRSVFLQTSSVSNGKYAELSPDGKSAITEMKLSGDVLFKEEYELKKTATDFVFEEDQYDFGIIKQSGGIKSYEFAFQYQGEQPIKITAVPTSCACTSAEISKKDFKKGDKGTLTVNFDPNLHREPKGKFFKTVSILSDPVLEEQPEIKIWVELDLDLGPEAYKLQDSHNDKE